jgi:hypothetical protein
MHIASPFAVKSSGGGPIVEFNRNHYLLVGMVILLAGIQLRMVDSYVLNSHASDFLLKVKGNVSLNEPKPAPLLSFMQKTNTLPTTTFHPPGWVGLAMMSVGVVLVLHSLAMKPPGG